MILSNSISNANLFKVLDSIRGKYTISDLEEYTVSLFFLKYIKIESANNKFIYDESIDIFNNDFLEHKASFLKGGINLNYVFEIIENDNPELKGTFSNFDLNFHSRIKEFDTVLNDLIKVISNLDFESENFGDFFDLLLNSIVNSKGRGFDSFQPKELTELMLSFLPKKDNLSIYNPFSGFSSLGLKLPENGLYYGEEIDRKVWTYSKLRLIAHSVKNKMIISNVDVFESWSTNDFSFDSIITNPPFNLKLNEFDDQFDVDDRFYIKNNANSFIVSQCYKRLNQNGKAIIVISNVFLNSLNTKERALREYLSNEGAVEMIISLPSSLLNYTSIPFSLIILSKSDEKINPLFIDARDCFIQQSKNNRILDLEKIYSLINSENEFSKHIDLSEIVLNDFNFFPARYLVKSLDYEIDKGYEIKKLGSLIDIISRQRIHSNQKGRMIKVRDLSDNVLTYYRDFNEVEITDLSISNIGNIAILPENSMLFSLKWKTLKPTFFTQSDSIVCYSSSDIIACKIKEDVINIEYLIYELEKDYVLKQLQSERTGSVISSLSRDRLLNIEIKVPILKDQQNIDVSLVKETKINSKLRELGLEEQFEKLKRDQIEDLSIKKHNIMQHLNNMQSSLDSLSIFMEQNNGQLNANQVIYPKYGTTVEKRFQRLGESLREAIYFVSNITNDLSFNKSELINVYELLITCKEKGIQNDNFDIEIFFDKDSFIVEDFEINPIIKFSNLDFFELYNNILENAILHGFTDSSKKYLFKIEIKFDQELEKLVISFLNNGKPFPKGMAERYQIKGEKAGLKGNKGIGSWKVNEIAKHFGAEIIAQDLNGEEFPVKIDLLINIENVE